MIEFYFLADYSSCSKLILSFDLYESCLRVILRERASLDPKSFRICSIHRSLFSLFPLVLILHSELPIWSNVYTLEIIDWPRCTYSGMMVARTDEEVTYPGLVLRWMDFTNRALELLQTDEGIGKVVYFIAVCPVSPIKQFWQLVGLTVLYPWRYIYNVPTDPRFRRYIYYNVAQVVSPTIKKLPCKKSILF